MSLFSETGGSALPGFILGDCHLFSDTRPCGAATLHDLAYKRNTLLFAYLEYSSKDLQARRNEKTKHEDEKKTSKDRIPL
jgi:hypothetical protein